MFGLPISIFNFLFDKRVNPNKKDENGRTHLRFGLLQKIK